MAIQMSQFVTLTPSVQVCFVFSLVFCCHCVISLLLVIFYIAGNSITYMIGVLATLFSCESFFRVSVMCVCEASKMIQFDRIFKEMNVGRRRRKK